MTTKPITPAEAKKKKTELPELVIRAVNSLLRDDYVVFTVTKYKAALAKEIEAGRDEYPDPDTRPWYYKIDASGAGATIPKDWFDFEPIFRKAGWNVSCDRPGFNESGETTWTFRAK